MKICLSCHQVTAGDESRYCGNCGRSWGEKFCGDGHANDPRANFCTTCGTLDWGAAPTRYVSMGVLSPALAILLLVWLVWLGLTHLALLGLCLLHGVLLIGALLLHTSQQRALSHGQEILAWLFVLWMLGLTLFFVPGKGGLLGAWLRGIPVTALRLAGRGGAWLLRLGGRSLSRALVPTRALDREKD